MFTYTKIFSEYWSHSIFCVYDSQQCENRKSNALFDIICAEVSTYSRMAIGFSQIGTMMMMMMMGQMPKTKTLQIHWTRWTVIYLKAKSDFLLSTRTHRFSECCILIWILFRIFDCIVFVIYFMAKPFMVGQLCWPQTANRMHEML